MPKKKHRVIWSVIVVISTLALIATTVLPYLTLVR